MASDVFQSAQDKDNELRTRVSNARQHATANPNDHDAQTELADACEEGKRLWETCERDLNRLDQATTDGDEHAMLVREINMARNLAKTYGTEAANASNAAASTAKKGLFGMGAKKPKATQPKAQKTNDIPLAIRLAIAAFAIAVLVSFMGKKPESKPTPESTPESAEQAETAQESEPTPEPTPEPEPESTAQVFDSDVATLEYRFTNDVGGNALVNFILTNKTDRTIMAYAENTIANGQFSIQTLGGSSSLSGIAPGTSGAFQLTFGVPTQTTLQSVDELTSLSGDVRIYDKDSVMTTLGYVHFDVVI